MGKFFIEKLSYLKRLKVYLTHDGIENPKAQIRIGKKQLRIKIAEDVEVQINLECTLAPEKCTMSIKKGFSIVDVPILQDFIFDESDSFPVHDELIPDSYMEDGQMSLTCLSCGKQLCQGSIIDARPLPSEYWLELSDLWFCTEHLAKTFAFPMHEVQSRPNTIFSGKTHILINKENLLPNAFQYQYSNDDDDYQWVNLKCSECKSELGKILTDTRRPKQSTEVQLWKHALSTPSNILRHYSVLTNFVESIVSLVENKNKRRFWVTDYGMTIAFRISVLNVSGFIRSSDTPSNPERFPGMENVLKLLYRLEEPDNDEAQKQWIYGFGGYRFEGSTTDIREIFQAVLKSTKRFPNNPSCTTLEEMFIGFLPRLCCVENTLGKFDEQDSTFV